MLLLQHRPRFFDAQFTSVTFVSYEYCRLFRFLGILIDSFIVETSFLLAGQHTEHRFIIITDQKPAEQFSFYSNIEIILVKPLSKNPLLKKIWWDIKLPAILKKVKADLFISFHNACSLTAVIPQIL